MLIVFNIGGLTQGDDRWHGMNELDEKIRSALDDYSGLSVRVHYYGWNVNWREIACKTKLLRNRYPPPEPFIIVVNAYSYGVGWGLRQLAKQLARKNLNIKIANTCDGIMRDWQKWLGAWRAMAGGFAIRLPQNVLAYNGFYQDVSRPSGVQPIGSTCLSWTNLKVEHTLADDEPEFHELAIKVCIEQAKLATRVEVIPVGAPESAATESRLSQK
jgi:hypothetical protein